MLSSRLRSVAAIVQDAAFVIVATIVFVGAANALVLLNSIVRTHFQVGGHDPRASYPNYRGVAWAATHFDEFAELKIEYRSFVGWRRKAFAGTTITIDGSYGFRRSVGQALNRAVYFLGGSTVWGTGVDDSTTLPSFFHASTSQAVLNLGEAGYTSRQSLDTLTNLLSYGFRPLAVVSYEGVNDVRVHCLKEIPRIPAHYYENQFNGELLRSRPSRAAKLAGEFFMFVPDRVHAKLFPVSDKVDDFDCHANPEKRRRVAQNLIDNWKFMAAAAKIHGAVFVAVLQPTVFTAASDSSHLPKADFDWKPEYEAVYPLVRQMAAGQCQNDACGVFRDLSTFDFSNEHVFIDFCHVSPNGNEQIARALALLLKEPHLR